MAQSQNTTLPQDTNNTRAIWNMKDRTITLVDPTTNETKIIGSFAVNTGNATTNETLTTNTGNATTNANLTAKFNALQGK